MSKSFEWAIKRAKDPKVSHICDRNWDEAEEVDVEKFLPSLEKPYWYIEGELPNGKQKKYKVSIDIQKDYDDFEYYTCKASKHDGTLLFIQELIDKVLYSVLTMGTLPKNKIDKIEEADAVKYTIGNLVVLDEFDGDWVPEDKPWMESRTTVLLPISVELA